MPKYFLRYRDPQKKGEFLQGLGGVAAAGSFLPEHDDQVLIADLAPESVALQSAAGAEIFDDIKFDFNAGAPVPATLPLNATLAQVKQQVGAPAAWKVTRGEGVTVIIVDQGVADAPEFAKKHSPLSFSLDGSSPWDSNLGHG